MSSLAAHADIAASSIGAHEKSALRTNLTLEVCGGDASACAGSFQTEEDVGLTETWRQVPGYPRYEVSSLGRVRSLCRGQPRILKPRHYVAGGRPIIGLRHEGKSKDFLLYQVVMLAFRGPCPPGQQIRHVLNNDVNDNRLANLAYGTPVENQADRLRHGTYVRGERHPAARLTDEQVAAIVADSRRQVDIAADFGISQSHVSVLKRAAARGMRSELDEAERKRERRAARRRSA